MFVFGSQSLKRNAGFESSDASRSRGVRGRKDFFWFLVVVAGEACTPKIGDGGGGLFAFLCFLFFSRLLRVGLHTVLHARKATENGKANWAARWTGSGLTKRLTRRYHLMEGEGQRQS